ncbi:MAG: glucose-1-phosphate thymidylyltransferase [Patescibacteria group bacterium]|nr:glucose-1-phosphate thymidylyltransferase [Patescibacteria group bacterium]
MAIKNIEDYFSNIPPDLGEIFEDNEELWGVLKDLPYFMKKFVAQKSGNKDAVVKGVKIGEVYIDHDVYIGRGTVIEHGAMIKGPTYIGENCEIRSGAYIRGNVYVASGSMVGHGAEIKNSILMGKAHAGHLNYLGDSIIGAGVNLGAGSILANLRFDEKEIKIAGKNTGLKKIGAILGDGSQLGCNTVLNPGVIFKKNIWYSGKPLKSGIYSRKKLEETQNS